MRTLPSPWTVPLSPEGIAHATGPSFGQGTFPANNRAVYEPFMLPVSRLMSKMSIAVSATGSGNADLGLYNDAGIRLGSLGSTALTTGTFSWTPATPILLEAGRRYFAAVSCSTTSANMLRSITALITGRMGGLSQEASALPLPSTMTPAQFGTTNMPFIALTFVQ